MSRLSDLAARDDAPEAGHDASLPAGRNNPAGTGSRDRPPPGRGAAWLRPLDWVLLLNGVLFALMLVFFYWDRFIVYRASVSLTEFFAYSCIYVVVIGLMWRRLRMFPVHWRLLAAGEVGLLLHFAGGLPVHAGQRLYDIRLLDWGDFRFDKPVHVVASVIVGLVLGAILYAFGVRLGRLHAVVMILLIVGAGAMWEIAEYLVVKVVPGAGVGGYDNNSQDMIANLIGSFVYVALPARWRASFEEGPPGGSVAVVPAVDGLGRAARGAP